MTQDSIHEIDYEVLRDSLAQLGFLVSVSELHGGVCGALCAGGANAAARWLDDCLQDQEIQVEDGVEDSLRALVTATWQMLESTELAFQPLLPDDDAPLHEQVEALAHWCHGFLGGLGGSAPDVGQADPQNVTGAEGETAVSEVLRDFAEISRAGLDESDLGPSEHPDFALAELVEYLRVSVQLVFEELGGRRAAMLEMH